MKAIHGYFKLITLFADKELSISIDNGVFIPKDRIMERFENFFLPRGSLNF